jgi:nitrite reductase/ring-hydroxylating ferredoxin subunit
VRDRVGRKTETKFGPAADASQGKDTYALGMATATSTLQRAAALDDVRRLGSLVAHVNGHTLALFADGDGVRALDNRCPHMGFPLHRGTLHDGILTCHWHHARFDVATGGTFDQWADDLRVFPVEVRDGEVFVDLTPLGDPLAYRRARLEDGLERNLPLVIAKSVIGLVDGGAGSVEPFRIGLEFGARYRAGGFGQGLTMHTCFANLLPSLDPDDRAHALHHGLSAVAMDSADMAPRFPVRALPGGETDVAVLKRWFRQFVEVRDSEGAERCIVSAVRAGADDRQLADMLFAAATDHRYIRTGHVLDFTNKALEALDVIGWDRGTAEIVLASLATEYAEADRMEESNAWRHPVDVVAVLEGAFADLPGTVRGPDSGARPDETVLLGDDPQAIADELLESLRNGASVEALAAAVTRAAAVRIARFHTSNEFGDWDTALHTFTFANAVEQGLRRSPSLELLRGVFDAAASVYLDRFLNVPAARIPEPDGADDPQQVLDDLPTLLDKQQQVNEAGELVARYLAAGGERNALHAALGKSLLREDRDFHTIQCVEAAHRQFELTGDRIFPIAAARYLAAHSPTVRAQGQTYHIARRLHRGEKLYEDDAA